MNSMNNETVIFAKKPYINPYLAGVCLGLVLLTSFVISGRGIGASGAISQTLVHIYDGLELQSDYLEKQQSAESWIESWIVIEVLGLFLGALLSAWHSGRFEFGVIRGPNSTQGQRLAMALAGGLFMGFAARLARGCTSGQALSGGALLSSGSWIFMLAVFVGAYSTIIIVKRYWQ